MEAPSVIWVLHIDCILQHINTFIVFTNLLKLRVSVELLCTQSLAL